MPKSTDKKPEYHEQDGSGFSMRRSHFWGIAVLIFISVLAIIWFSIPGAQTRHILVSPSGNMNLEVGEMCRDGACGQIIVLNFLSPDGERYRNACQNDLREDRSVFVTVSADWSADETNVVLHYADAQGIGGQVDLELAVDCAEQ